MQDLKPSKRGKLPSKKQANNCEMDQSVSYQLGRIQHLVDKTEHLFLLLGVVSLFVMMVLITVNSVFRYLLSSPITGMYESVELYFMMAVFYFSIAHVESEGANIKADLISRRFTTTTKRRIDLIYFPLTFLILSWITFLVYERTLNFWQRNTATTGVVQFPIYLSWSIILVGLLLLLVRILVTTGERLTQEYPASIGGSDD